jgi:hypothetical protein
MSPKIIMSVIAASWLSLTAPAVLANSLTYTAPAGGEPGKFSGELPIARIGPLALPDGTIKFKDDEMIVEAVPEWLFDREPVLKGAIVRAEVVARKDTSVLAGLVYFTDGSWLPNLGPGRSLDEITTTTGEKLKGRIKGRSGQFFRVQPLQGSERRISFADVKSIKSARAFSFNIFTPTARLSPTDNSLSIESNLITLAASELEPRHASVRARVPASTLPGADPGVSNVALGTFVALDIISEIAPAIAIPLVLNRSTQKHALKQINDALKNQSALD